MKDGRLRATARSEGIRSPSECLEQLPAREKAPSPRFNSMAVKDGKLLEGQLGRGPFARSEMPIKQISKASQKAKKCTFCHTEAAWHCGTDRSFEG